MGGVNKIKTYIAKHWLKVVGGIITIIAAFFVERYANKPHLKVKFQETYKTAEMGRSIWSAYVEETDWLSFEKSIKITVPDKFQWNLYKEINGAYVRDTIIQPFNENFDIRYGNGHTSGNYRLYVTYDSDNTPDPAMTEFFLQYPRSTANFVLVNLNNGRRMYAFDDIDDDTRDTIVVQQHTEYLFTADKKPGVEIDIIAHLWRANTGSSKVYIDKPNEEVTKVVFYEKGKFSITHITTNNRQVENRNVKYFEVEDPENEVVRPDTTVVYEDDPGGDQMNEDAIDSLENENDNVIEEDSLNRVKQPKEKNPVLPNLRIGDEKLEGKLTQYLSDNVNHTELENELLGFLVSDRILVNDEISIISFLTRLKMTSDPQNPVQIVVLNIGYNDYNQITTITVRPINGIVK